MSLTERKVQLARAEATLDAEERRRTADTTLAERLHEAALMYILTVSELSRRCATPEQLCARLMADAPVDLSALWRASREGTSHVRTSHDVRGR